jgi:hypothetical protein
MLPTSYEVPAAIALVIGGAIACFAGYRLFRIVLAIYGFIAGAMLASSMMASSNAVGMVVAALVGGLIGSIVFFFAYFLGIALIGAGAGALIVHVGWTQVSPTEPPAIVIVVFAILGTIAALILQRYVIIVGTAFSGAWTLIVGALALLGDRAPARGRGGSDVWILYPLNPRPGERWVVVAWIALALIGTGVQLGLTGRRR